MAYLPADDKQQQQPGQSPSPVQQVDTTGAGSVSTPSSGGSDASAGGPPSSYGAGGSGWTNIQSYLGANQGNTGSSQALSNQVGGAFKQDQTSLDSQSRDAKSAGQSQVDNNNVSQDKASQMVQDASKGYNYGGAQSDAYNQNTQALKGNLSAAYQGPTSFNYGLSSASQNYGQGLASDQGFNGVMQSVYDKAGANPMGSGGLALQNQLDSSNGTLTDTRSQLLNQYAGLQGNVANTSAATQAALQGDQAAFTQNQHGLKDYLTGQSSNDQSQINDQVAQSQKLLSDLGTWQSGFDTSNNYGPNAQASTVSTFDAPTVNNSNVAGVNDQRNQFNTLSDILGLGSKINQGTALNLDNVNGTTTHSMNGSPGYQTQFNVGHELRYPNEQPVPDGTGKGPLKRPGSGDNSASDYYRIAQSLGLL